MYCLWGTKVMNWGAALTFRNSLSQNKRKGASDISASDTHILLVICVSCVRYNQPQIIDFIFYLFCPAEMIPSTHSHNLFELEFWRIFIWEIVVVKHIYNQRGRHLSYRINVCDGFESCFSHILMLKEIIFQQLSWIEKRSEFKTSTYFNWWWYQW